MDGELPSHGSTPPVGHPYFRTAAAGGGGGVCVYRKHRNGNFGRYAYSNMSRPQWLVP